MSTSWSSSRDIVLSAESISSIVAMIGKPDEPHAELAQFFPRGRVIGLRIGARLPFAVEIKAGLPGELVRYSERFDYDRLRQVLFVAMEFSPADGAEGWMTPLAHRQFYPEELSALLHYNGFAITERHGDFFRAPLTASSATMILHCRPRRRT